MANHWSEKYIAKELRPITKVQIETLRKTSAKYIFVHDKEGNATCTHCQREINVGHTRHLSTHTCPHCHKEMTIQHEWRMTKKLRNIEWLAIPKVLDEHTLVLRYVMFSQYENKPYTIKERARMYITDFRQNPEHYEWSEWGKCWTYGKRSFFQIHAPLRSYVYNPYECWTAQEYKPKFFDELNKLECFKYYKAEKQYDNTRMVSQLHFMVRYGKLNEMCHKIGMDKFIDENFNYYIRNNDRGIVVKNKKTSLKGVLGLSNAQFKILKEHQSVGTFNLLKQYGVEYVNDIKEALDANVSDICTLMDLVRLTKLTTHKLLCYITNSHISPWELKHYYSILSQLNADYMEDKNYLLPKDFRKTEHDITRAFNAMKAKEKETLSKEQSEKIRLISEAIYKTPELMDYFKGTRGLKIFVPESVADLAREGMNLHNCIGTYVDRIIRKNTLLFFIRKIDEPDESYVAFEYANGTIIQIREDHNRQCEDTNVVSFAEEFVKRLNAVDIMKQLRAA